MSQVSTRAERWLPVVGYEGIYEVSNLGRVRSLDRIVFQCRNGARLPHRFRARIMKQGISPDGYPRLMLSRDARPVMREVHRLVLEAFDKPCPPGMEALHGPAGQRVNTWPGNLRWGTSAENAADRNRDGTQSHGAECSWAKLTEDQVADIREAYAAGGVTQRELAAKFGVSRTMISYIVTRKKWSR